MKYTRKNGGWWGVTETQEGVYLLTNKLGGNHYHNKSDGELELIPKDEWESYIHYMEGATGNFFERKTICNLNPVMYFDFTMNTTHSQVMENISCPLCKKYVKEKILKKLGNFK